MERTQKKIFVDSLTKDFKEMKGAVVTDFTGVTVNSINDLRSELRKSGVRYRVVKNNLAALSAKDASIEGFDQYFVGPTAIAYGFDDPVLVAKLISDYAKKEPKLLVRAGYVEGKVIDKDGVKALSNLPSREVLIAQLLSVMNAPMTSFVGAVAAVPRSLVRVLDAIAKKKESAV